MTEKRGPGRPRKNPEIAHSDELVEPPLREVPIEIVIMEAWTQSGLPAWDAHKLAAIAVRVVREHG